MDASALPRERVLWLDGVKCVAIIAVLLNHTQWVVYSSPWLMTFSTCCISLFILIAGMTSYLSDQRHARTWLQTFLLGSRRIFLAYLVTVFIYHAADASQHGQPMLFFDFEAYLAHLIRFDLPAPAYYVALYLQLMLVNRFLYRCIEGLPERGRLVWEIGGGVFLLLFAAYATNRTNILGIYGGGGKLLGGSYLFLYYLGMLLMKHRVFEPVSRKKSLLLLAVTSPLLAGWYVMIHLTQRRIDVYFHLGGGYNPPSISIGVFAILMLFWVYSVFTLLDRVPALHWCTACAAFIGRHTLYIFLFHAFVLQYLLPGLPSIPLKGVIALAALILLPIAWEYAVSFAVRFLRRLQKLDA